MAGLETNNKTSEQLQDELKQLKRSLPKEIWFGVRPLYLYQGFWCPELFLEHVVAFQTHFQAHDTDIILASLPKTGTTWLKSLLFAIVNRKSFSDISQHPLHTKNGHELIPHFEVNVYTKIIGKQPDFTEMSLPRLFATHTPYPALPKSIKSYKCRIIYICRNPLDTFISSWHFYNKTRKNSGLPKPDIGLEELLDKYCKGVLPYGPYDDHVLEYWKASIQQPNKVLFLEYEGLKKEPKDHLIRLAKFVDCPFSEEEEKGNGVDEIIELCSLKSLQEMEVNKSGKYFPQFENKDLFRKGDVGDWKNYLTPSMAKKLDQILLEKLEKAGFSSTY